MTFLQFTNCCLACGSTSTPLVECPSAAAPDMRGLYCEECRARNTVSLDELFAARQFYASLKIGNPRCLQELTVFVDGKRIPYAAYVQREAAAIASHVLYGDPDWDGFG